MLKPAMLKNAILIAGPTASGKSALAMEMARNLGGIIVNADSMQVYDVLHLLTARPSSQDMAQMPHMLFGHVNPATPYSTGRWLDDVERILADETGGRPVIFVGGTGLYFRALLEGMSPMPDIPQEIREKWRGLQQAGQVEDLHRQLAERDPQMAERLRPTDAQRIVRALEVHETSGHSILYWQAQRSTPLVDGATARKLVLSPDRALLGQRIDRRFEAMVDGGALEEVRALLSLGLDPALPAMKAIGVKELEAYLKGELGLDEATRLAMIATRQYAKRQMTWFRNQFLDWEIQTIVL